METETQENLSKQRNLKFPKSPNKIKSKGLETMEINESNQIKNKNKTSKLK